MSDKGFEGGFAGLQASEKRLTTEGLELGVRIMQLEEDLRACQAHTEYLEQRIERLRAVARKAALVTSIRYDPKGQEDIVGAEWRLKQALNALQSDDM